MITSDRQFVAKLNRLIDEYLDNPAFSVEMVCQAVENIWLATIDEVFSSEYYTFDPVELRLMVCRTEFDKLFAEQKKITRRSRIQKIRHGRPDLSCPAVK